MVTSLLRARGVLRLFEFFKSTFDHRFSRRPWIAFTIFTLALIACNKPKNDDSGATNNPPAMSYTLGGSVTGLTGTGLVLQSNGADDKPISTNGDFTFATALDDGTHYSVTVLTQPSGQTCTVQNGSGTLNGANVTDVAVSCTANSNGGPKYTVGGSVTGLAGTVTLQNNGTDNRDVALDGGFTFSLGLATGATYNVTVLHHPTGQTCAVTHGSGTIASANVSNITVTCTTNNTGSYSIGGTVSGLTGKGLALQNNGGDRKPISADGSFTFATKLANNSAYDVTIYAQPKGQTCTVQNGKGTLAGANVTNVIITCGAPAAINDRVWTPPELMETNNNDTRTSKAVFDKDGNIYVFWIQSNGTLPVIYWRRYDNASAQWNPPTMLEKVNLGASGTPEAGVDGSGNVFVTWIENNNSYPSVYTKRYDAAAAAWGNSELHDKQNDNSVIEIAQGVSANGDAIVLWTQSDNTFYSLWARRYDGATNQWISTPTGPTTESDPTQSAGDYRIEWTNNSQASKPAIAITADGNALAAWVMGGSGIYNVNTNYFDHNQAKWLNIKTPYVVSNALSDADSPSIAMNSSGNAMVVWQQMQGKNYVTDVWVNRFTSATKLWGDAKVIDSDSGLTALASIEMDSTGNAIAVWAQDNGTGRFDIKANRYDASTASWAVTAINITDVTNNPYGLSELSKIKIDATGNAQIIFSLLDSAVGSVNSVWHATYNSDTGTWGSLKIHESGSGRVQGCTIATDGASKFMALWSQTDGTRYNLWFNILQ